MMTESITIPVLLGPTGSGKTALASRLDPSRFEVVSVDSRQVYRRLEISSAAPSQEERALVPHHLVSVLEPDDPVDAAWFVREARRAMQDILKRGKLPILVGGAGFYLHALMTGGLTNEPLLPEVQKHLARMDADEKRTLFSQLFPGRLIGSSGDARKQGRTERAGRPIEQPDADPAVETGAGAARIHPNDSYRIERALGIELSRQKSADARLTEDGLADERPPGPDLRYEGWWLDPPKQDWWDGLYRRVGRMLRDGMIDEVLGVYRDCGACHGLQSLGCLDVIRAYADEGSQSESELRALQERITILHRQYGKRQRTWFRNKTPFSSIQPEEFEQKMAAFV